jgi:hypothetical protein
VGRWIIPILIVVSTGCRSIFGLDDPIAGSPADADRDTITDASSDARPDSSFNSCSAAGLTCSGVTTAHECGNNCWVGCDETVTESVAEARCGQWKQGGKLAPFKSQSDQDCFRTNIQPTNDAWTGLVQAASASAVDTNWSWNGDNQTPAFLNWKSGQPDDVDLTENGQEQCASIIDAQNTWQDTPCSSTLTFGCRVFNDN